MPVSAGLRTDTDAYFDALTAYRAGDPAVIVGQLAEASLAAIGNGRQLVTALRRAEVPMEYTDRKRNRAWRAGGFGRALVVAGRRSDWNGTRRGTGAASGLSGDAMERAAGGTEPGCQNR